MFGFTQHLRHCCCFRIGGKCNSGVGIEYLLPIKVGYVFLCSICIPFLGNYLPNIVTIAMHKRENPSHTDKILVCDVGVQLCVCKYQDTGTFKKIEPCRRNCGVLVPSLL